MFSLGNKDRIVDYDCSSENVRLVSYVALNCKTLEGFAGLMRKYCSHRCGPIFTEIFKQLLLSYDDDDDTATATKDDKLMALLKNQVSTTTSTKPIYNDRKQYYCRSSFYGQLQALRGFIDENEVDQFQLKDRGPFAVYCRGISLMPNRNSRRKRNHRYILSLKEIV